MEVVMRKRYRWDEDTQAWRPVKVVEVADILGLGLIFLAAYAMFNWGWK